MRPGREPGRPPLLPLCLYEFSLQSDGDIITNKDAAGLEGSIPGQAEILSIDLCASRDRNPSVAPWILGRRRWQSGSGG